MKHLFGRVYFKAPCFIGIRCNSKGTAIILNVALGAIVVTMIVIALV